VSEGETESCVCGGAQLAFPGTVVIVENKATGLTVNTISTDRSGASGSEVCDVLFPGRCNTDAPGSFCATIDATLGDRIEVQVEDNFRNLITLDAGNMRDERTGAEVIGPQGGSVTFPDDERYEAFIPEGAFDEPVIFQLTPITDVGVGLRSVRSPTERRVSIRSPRPR
jgi:hypothetical protein